MTSARLEAFSDGVFAVAITLLALDLAVAGPGHGSLAHQLADHWPSFVAYVVSFFVVGITWVNHHALVDTFVKVDRKLLFLNLVGQAVALSADRPRQPGYTGAALLASRIGACSATVGVAAVSYRWLERPVIFAVRARSVHPRRRAGTP